MEPKVGYGGQMTLRSIGGLLIIARLSFRKERIGHGTHFIRFLTEVARKYGFNHIAIECANTKSSAFAKKFGFYSIDGRNTQSQQPI